MTKLTSEQLKRMSNEEIRAFWVRRQIEQKSAGRPAFDVLIGLDGGIDVDLRDLKAASERKSRIDVDGWSIYMDAR